MNRLIVNGKVIAIRLIELDMSPEKLAAQLDCSIATIQNMKRGRPIRPETARKAAKILGVKLSELIAENEKQGGPEDDQAA